MSFLYSYMPLSFLSNLIAALFVAIQLVTHTYIIYVHAYII